MSFSLETLDVFVMLLLPRAKTLCPSISHAKTGPTVWRAMFDPISGIGMKDDFRRREIIDGPAAAMAAWNIRRQSGTIWVAPPVQGASGK